MGFDHPLGLSVFCLPSINDNDNGNDNNNVLIYVMGEKADDILNSFGLSDDERKVYRTVEEKFDNYFEPQRNVIFQRAKFNQRKQLPGESVDDFITDLHCLADRCIYGDLRNEMVRDRIDVGLLDRALSEKLQLDASLTMETAVTPACQSEGVYKQQSVVRGKSIVDKTELVNTVDAANSAQGVKKGLTINKCPGQEIS